MTLSQGSPETTEKHRYYITICSSSKISYEAMKITLWSGPLQREEVYQRAAALGRVRTTALRDRLQISR